MWCSYSLGTRVHLGLVSPDILGHVVGVETTTVSEEAASSCHEAEPPSFVDSVPP
jgi:hypothetical protein